MATHKSVGSTDSERYLANLSEKSFLSLWSYPNVFRDQGRKGGKGDGKELCDLLVVFDRDVIIFSDKSCAFKDTGDTDRDWARWYSRAIKKSANQIFGAERWIRENPDRLYLDPRCAEPFPIPFKSLEDVAFHRVVVALGAKARCQAAIGGSGSLLIYPNIVGDAHTEPTAELYTPFAVGNIDPAKGYIHVFDDVALDIVLGELDTITDFVKYLRKKESLIASGKLAFAAGEEDLLAFYLKDTDASNEHAFVFPGDVAGIAIEENHWKGLKTNPQYLAKKAADGKSYLWDKIIEEFSSHALRGTLVYDSPKSIAENEFILRILASESRLSRRVLSHALVDQQTHAVAGKSHMRTILSNDRPDTAYVSVLVPSDGVTEGKYRQFRREWMSGYCFVLAWMNRDLKHVVGIGTEAGLDRDGRSFDLVLINQPDKWTPEMEEEARQIQISRNILFRENVQRTEWHDSEYPETTVAHPKLAVGSHGSRELRPPWPAKARHVGRNEPCPCGSGAKFKHCCLRGSEGRS
jgi:hypothetical protein